LALPVLLDPNADTNALFLTTDPSGNVYYQESGVVYKWTTATQTSTPLSALNTAINAPGVRFVYSMAADASGNLYLYLSDAKLYIWNGSTLSAAVSFPGRLVLWVAADPSGNVYAQTLTFPFTQNSTPSVYTVASNGQT
jgi:hypothetical protein